MGTGPGAPAIGLNTQPNVSIGTMDDLVTGSRGGKGSFIGFGTDLGGTPLSAADDNSFENDLPVIVMERDGVGMAPSGTGTWEGAIPEADSVSPSTALAADPPFAFTVTGVGFEDGDVIVIDGIEQTTTFGSSTSLTCTVDPADFGVGTYDVQVSRDGVLSPTDATLELT